MHMIHVNKFIIVLFVKFKLLVFYHVYAKLEYNFWIFYYWMQQKLGQLYIEYISVFVFTFLKVLQKNYYNILQCEIIFYKGINISL